jgi:signal transduction histidine kinase/ligand-binding sensor domain-containing protein
MRITCSIVVALCLALPSVPRSASAEDGSSLTLVHKRFGAAEGSPNNTNKLVQTHDGFLWLVGSGTNLIRFDGKNFYQFEKSAAIGALAVAPDGDLWVAEASRLLRVPSADLGRFTLSGLEVHTFAEPGLKITNLECFKSGVLWIGTTLGLFRYNENRVEAVGPRHSVRHITEAPDGRALVTTTGEFLDIVGSTVTQKRLVPGRLGVKDGDIFQVLEDSHGTTWYMTTQGVARETNGQLQRIAPYGPDSPSAVLAHEDAHGRIWITKEQGLFRVTSTGLEPIEPAITVLDFLNDRDSNLWVGTLDDGLYQFKEAAVRMFTTADGLPGNTIAKVIEAHDGAIWASAFCGGIARFDGRRFQAFGRKNGLSDECVFGLAEDSHHDLWVGTTVAGAFRYRNGVFEQSLQNAGLHDAVYDILHARDGSIWLGTRLEGVSRLKEEQLRVFTTADGLPSNLITRVIEDRSGVIWVGTQQGVARLVNGRFETVSFTEKTHAVPVGEDRDGGFYVTYRADHGTVTTRIDPEGNATPVGLEMASMVETQSGDLWIGGPVFARVWSGQLSRPRPHDEPLDYETFSAEDGIATGVGSDSIHNMILARDGTIWAATSKGIAMFDPQRLPATRARPLVYLAGVTIGRSTLHPAQQIVLPAGTSRVEIALAAVELSAPEKIQIQYRLDGVDSEWLNAGAVPRAIYSTLPPGNHPLHVRASNRSGIWDRQGVVFTVTQQPFFYQTWWFRVAVLAAALLAMVAIVRLRVAQIARAMSARFDERLAERTRVARELHDTLLQTVQASKMVAEHALREPGDHDRVVHAIEQLSTWLGQATDEGRAALQALRVSTIETNDLAEAFRRAIEECRINFSPEISFSVEGRSRTLHPIVRDEIYRIGYEAIRNACVHSRASQIDVRLTYDRDLVWRISDDGVGMDRETSETGKAGHFGLRGMRERAERIGATLTVATAPGAGTVITLVVPGRHAFR